MIASIHNPLIKHVVRLRENRRYREEHGSVCVSGFKLVREIAALVAPQRVFVENLEDAIPCSEIYQVAPPIFKKITGLPSPEPIAALFPLPTACNLSALAPLLVLDAIQDPGNMGTLLRTALALGWGGVFFLPGCVDPLSDKVLRASRGALFRLPWQEGSLDELILLQAQAGLVPYVADLEGEILTALKPSKKSMLVLSNEGRGTGASFKEFGQKITIPMEGEMESLNVAIAGAIIMYHLSR